MPPPTEHEKEVAKFNRPYNFHKFPTTVFQGYKDETGKHQVRWQIVDSERALELALESGWCDHPDTALARIERHEDKRAVEAAHRHHDDRNMSPKALAESQRVEDSMSGGHVLEIPEETKRGPGRPRKE